MSLFVNTNNYNQHNATNTIKNHSKKIDWDNIWNNFYNKQNSTPELDNWFQYYNLEMNLLNSQSAYESMGLNISNNTYHNNLHKAFKTGANATTLNSVYNQKNGNMLAQYAKETANYMTQQRGSNNEYYCAKGVRLTLEKAGIKKDTKASGNAYEYAGILENNSNFKEIKVNKEDLKNLPAGCIIVYNNKETGSKPSDIYGHISITLGNGQEASDRVCDIKDRSNEYRVFVWS